MENNPLSNVRDVMRLIEGSDQRFQCMVDLTLDGVTEAVAYVADKDDVAATGQWVYQQIISGAAGEIAEYTPPPPPSEEALAAMAREHRWFLLRAVDSVVSNPLRWNSLSESTQKEIADYRQALLDMPEQEGFPAAIIWPETPAILR